MTESRLWIVDYIARRLDRLVSEHGAPNTFGCSEVGEANMTTPGRVGIVGRRHLDELRASLRSRCLTFTVDYNPRTRRFEVKP